MPPSKPHRSSALGLALSLGLIIAAPAQADSLRSQLASLAKQNGIAVEGLERIGAEPSKSAEGDVAEKIKTLLSDYNFMMVGQGSKIERLTITSLKRHDPRPSLGGRVKTQRLGTHHQVQATLSGPNGVEIGTALLVDTGATTVVLPTSMIGALGFRGEQLQTATSQTAGGTIQVKIGLLKSVQVGDVLAENVQVSFIADQRLGGARLLGMSFLNRFRFSLDDGNNELLLLAK